MTGRCRAAVAGWLGLAASPVFVLMAALTYESEHLGADWLCSAGHGSGVGGMIPMYLLMALFHLPPWLRLLSKEPAA